MRRTLALAIALMAVISASLPLMSSSGARDGTTSSPWPCLQADQRHTGCSQANLSDNPGQIALEMPLHNDGYSSGLVLGPDGTIYIGDWHSGMLFAIGRDGKERWRFQAINGIGSPPTIGEDGSIYFGTFYYYWGTGSTANNLYALNPNGTVRWFYP
ncbi:MAG: PQQ-binding-like beta-propeller repeat protein, partial [Methanomassiliicoccales archaeon]|nr:PQQ-binding-like beta-propeller repeat protein [Methanomassiliicoccales archaeon]